ncbi:MAG: copper homeostasis protein CutC [Bacillota bacterium]|nr:copper homeostasis protein CutC [Bacillota bacterium]
MISIEIIASSVHDILAAKAGGADRIELVSALSEGGLTPSDGMVRAAASIDIAHAVMVRPSSASFCYREDELTVMRADLERMREIGVRHVVLGILDEDGLPDVGAVNRLLEGLELTATFHRAIDESADLFASLDRLRQCPAITHVLTSGGPGRAVDHLETIAAMIDHTDLRIIVGSGVQASNIEEIRTGLGDREYDLHLGTAVRGRSVQGLVDPEEVRRVVGKLKT